MVLAIAAGAALALVASGRAVPVLAAGSSGSGRAAAPASTRSRPCLELEEPQLEKPLEAPGASAGAGQGVVAARGSVEVGLA